MAIFSLAPDQTIAQMWSNGVRGGILNKLLNEQHLKQTTCQTGFQS